ncbi:hypothetical protein LX32DRAFT_688427 [Colletotrichum zoysiae]|uniref:Uncharacterized protein n=1 Tax=Colletotrichum zoysiae TaxID=1216348 RepID=A0AAD9HW19_9PEZI|nr:hypothetical protein LX32DRAFT_688427 [Colletotrichum zoysiae]
MPLPVLSKQPIPGVTLSVTSLIALADLHTIANRAALTGTSSWADALVLAPGLHYQHAAECIAGNSGNGTSSEASGSGGDDGKGNADGNGGRKSTRPAGVYGTQEHPGGRTTDFRVTNPGMLLFLSQLREREERAQKREKKRSRKRTDSIVEALGADANDSGGEGKIIDVDIGPSGHRHHRHGETSAHHPHWNERGGHLLYLATPALTVAAITVMICLADWWGLGSILALIGSRILNIYTIKQRTPLPPPKPPTPPSPPSKIYEYLVPLSPKVKVRMRGTAADLASLTTDAWQLSTTAMQGYLNAAAKLAVYIVAIFSNNVSQAGNLVMLGLLLASAGLLGLSNGAAKSVRGQGRVAREWSGTGSVIQDGQTPG